MLGNKLAVVTGASEGIGFGIAEAFIHNDAEVIIIARSELKLNAAKSKLGQNGGVINILKGDLTMPSEVMRLGKEIREQWPAIDILVNNAGIADFKPFPNCNERDLDQHIDLNFKAPFLLSQILLPSLKRQQGNIINISSYFASRMLAGRPSSIYSSTKGAIESWTKALAFELGSMKIRVNSIAPGTIDTPMMQRNLASLSDIDRSNFLKNIQSLYPLGKVGGIEDVAQTAVFLASDKAKWITGANIAVDGGLTTH
ncbi:MAG: SDR family oxidoreductase [Gammaproteobacteria bacterium]|nr:SDR family oxidoreductase [Gammaproteobacteria bacterium]